MESFESEMWAVYAESSSFYIARLVVPDDKGRHNVTSLFFGRETLPELRKLLRAKGLEPTKLIDDVEPRAIEYWV